MTNFMTENEQLIRLSFFFGILIMMVTWEFLAPRRTLTLPRVKRWPSNLALVVVNTVVLRLLFPTAAVGVALFAQTHQWGILNNLALPLWLSVPIAVLVLDCAIYWQHVMMHQVPMLWRLHRVHHVDLDIDVTTGSRFHTIEIVLSMLIKFLIIVILGPAVLAVIVFEIILNAMAMFNHSNAYLPPTLDKWLRLLVVTPDMHRVHHSTKPAETNSNYGFNVPWWDRLFATYTDQPQQGHLDMTIGVSEFRNPNQCARLPNMLALPFQQPIPASSTAGSNSIL